MNDDTTPPPFGTYSLSPFRNRLRVKSGQWREHVRFVSSVLRKASMFGLREPFDVEPAVGFRVRLFPSNNATDKQCYMGLEIRSTRQIDAIQSAVDATPTDTCNFLDIGGNSGMYSIAGARAAKNANKKFNLVAIEANPDMVERLRFNLEASKVPNAQIVECAVSDTEGTVYLSLAKPNLGQATIVEADDSDTTIAVPARRLQDILDGAKMHQIDFMKIDIEGHEVPALQPFFQSVDPSRFPTTILAETTHDDDDAITKLLLQHGYEVTQDMGCDALFTLKDAG